MCQHHRSWHHLCMWTSVEITGCWSCCLHTFIQEFTNDYQICSKAFQKENSNSCLHVGWLVELYPLLKANTTHSVFVLRNLWNLQCLEFVVSFSCFSFTLAAVVVNVFSQLFWTVTTQWRWMKPPGLKTHSSINSAFSLMSSRGCITCCKTNSTELSEKH